MNTTNDFWNYQKTLSKFSIILMALLLPTLLMAQQKEPLSFDEQVLEGTWKLVDMFDDAQGRSAPSGSGVADSTEEGVKYPKHFPVNEQIYLKFSRNPLYWNLDFYFKNKTPDRYAITVIPQFLGSRDDIAIKGFEISDLHYIASDQIDKIRWDSGYIPNPQTNPFEKYFIKLKPYTRYCDGSVVNVQFHNEEYRMRLFKKNEKERFSIEVGVATHVPTRYSGNPRGCYATSIFPMRVLIFEKIIK